MVAGSFHRLDLFPFSGPVIGEIGHDTNKLRFSHPALPAAGVLMVSGNRLKSLVVDIVFTQHIR